MSLFTATWRNISPQVVHSPHLYADFELMPIQVLELPLEPDQCLHQRDGLVDQEVIPTALPPPIKWLADHELEVARLAINDRFSLLEKGDDMSGGHARLDMHGQ